MNKKYLVKKLEKNTLLLFLNYCHFHFREQIEDCLLSDDEDGN